MSAHHSALVTIPASQGPDGTAATEKKRGRISGGADDWSGAQLAATPLGYATLPSRATGATATRARP